MTSLTGGLPPSLEKLKLHFRREEIGGKRPHIFIFVLLCLSSFITSLPMHFCLKIYTTCPEYQIKKRLAEARHTQNDGCSLLWLSLFNIPDGCAKPLSTATLIIVEKSIIAWYNGKHWIRSACLKGILQSANYLESYWKIVNSPCGDYNKIKSKAGVEVII